jgi:hypothetical protein
VYRHVKRGHLPADHRLVLRRAEVRAEQRWREIGLDATVFMAEEAEVAERFIGIVLDRLAQGRLHLSVEELIRAAAFLYDIEQRDKYEAWRQSNVDRMAVEMAHALSIVGDVAGDAARNEVVRRARADPQTEFTMTFPEFAALREAVAEEDRERANGEINSTAASGRNRRSASPKGAAATRTPGPLARAS